MVQNEKFIDIRKSIGDKNPTLLKILPNFIINYIRRTIHEEYMNKVLHKYKNLRGLAFVEKIINHEFKVNIQEKGFENIGPNKRYIFVANHPWGGLEAASLLHIVGKKFPEPRFIVNDLLMSIKNYHPLFIPVNKHGAQGRENARLLDENYKSNKPILIFPAGLVSRRIKGTIVDLEWKKNFISKAVQYQRDIIPVYIDAKNSNFFYNLSNFRKAIGIKANIEMFYLANELMKNKGADLPLFFGKPIPYQTFNKSKKPKEWANLVKEHTYQLKDDYQRRFTPNPQL